MKLLKSKPLKCKVQVKLLFFVALLTASLSFAVNTNLHLSESLENAVNVINVLNSPLSSEKCQDQQAMPAIIQSLKKLLCIDSDCFQRTLKPTAQQCVVDLCGPVEDHPAVHAAMTNESFANNLKPQVMEEFDKNIMPSMKERWDKITEQCIDNINQHDDFLDEYIDSASHEDLMYLMDHVFSQYYDYSFKLPPNVVQSILKYKNRILRAGKWNQKKFDQKASAWAEQGESVFDFHFPENFPIVLQREIERYAELRKTAVKQAFISTLREKLKNTLSEEEEFFQNEFNDILLPKKSWILRRKPSSVNQDICSNRENCKKVLSLGLRDMVQNYRQRRNSTSEEEMMRCKSYFAVHHLVDQRVKEFKEILPDVKQQFMSKVMSRYSSVSQNSFQDFLNNTLTASFPLPSYEEMVEKLTKGKLDRVESFSGGQRSLTLLTKSVDNILDFFVNDCNNTKMCYSFAGFEASTLTTDTYDIINHHVNLSLYSCTYHDHGQSIFAHELGHALSSAFHQDSLLSSESYEKYQQLRECANNQYKGKRRISSRTGGNEPPLLTGDATLQQIGDTSPYAEEDTADIISYLTFSEDENLFTCSFAVSPSVDNKLEYDIDRLISDDSRHSPSLLRILREAVYKNKEFSPACQTAVDIYKKKAEFKKCF